MTADPYTVPAEGGTWHWQAGAGRWDWAPDAPPADQPRPNVQHVGTRDNAGIARIESRNVAQAEAEAKAAADPSSLSYDEALRLTDTTFSRLLSSGQLVNATGLPGRRTKGRQR